MAGKTTEQELVTILTVEGEKEYTDSLKKSANAQKFLDSEMKLVNATFGENNKSLEAVTARNKVLNKQVEEQGNKVSKLAELVAKANTQYGESNIKTQNWQKQLNEARVTLNTFTDSLENNKREIQALNISGEVLTPKVDFGAFDAEISKASSAFRELQTELVPLKSSIFSTEESIKNATKNFGENSLEVMELKQKLELLQGEEENLKNKIQNVSDGLAKQNAAMGAEARAAIQSSQSIDKHATSLEKDSVSAKKAANSTSELNNKLQTMANVVKAVIVGMAGKSLFDALIGNNAQYESALASFEILLDSVDKADILMQSITDLAVATPLDSASIQKSAQMLLGFGIAGEEVIDTIKRLGDLSKGNAELLDRISLAYGQMVSKGKVTGEELRQMVEAQVPLLKGLSEYMGKSTAEVTEMISNAEVSVDDLNGAIKKMTSQGGQFFGMMDKQAKTFTGSVNSLKGELAEIGRGIGTEAFDILKDAISDVLYEIEKLRVSGDLEIFQENTGRAIAELIKKLADLTKFVYENKEAIITLTSAYLALKAGLAIQSTIQAAITSFVGMKAAAIGVAEAEVAATVASRGFTLALKAIPFIAVAAGVATVVGLLFSLGHQADENTVKFKDMAESYREAQERMQLSSQKTATEISNIQSDIDKLQGKDVNFSINTKNEEQLQDIESAVFRLNQKGINVKIDYDSGKIDAKFEDLQKQAESFKISLEIEASTKELDEVMKRVADAEKGYRDAQEKYKEISTSSYAASEINARKKLYEDELKIKDELLKKNRELKISQDELSSSVSAAIPKYKNLTDAQTDVGDAAQTMAEFQDEASKEISRLVSNIKDLNQAQQEQAESGSLSADTVMDLITKYPQLADKIQELNGVYSIEKKALDEVKAATIATSEATIQGQINSARQTAESTRQKLDMFKAESKGLMELAKLYSKESTLPSSVVSQIEQATSAGSIDKAKGIAQLENQLKISEEAIANLEKIQSKIGTVVSNVGIKSSKDKKTTTKKEKTQEELLKEQTDLFVNEYDRREKLAEAHVERMDRYSLWGDPTDKIQTLNDTANYYKKLLDSLDERAFESAERREEIELDLTSKYYEWADKQAEAYTAMYDKLDKLSDKYIQNQERKESWGNEDTAASAWGRIADRYKSALNNLDQMHFDSVEERASIEEEFTARMENAIDQQNEAYQKEYDERRQVSENWIQDRKLYDDWGADNEIAAWKRVKAYTEEYYKDGKITHKEYVQYIREIDKSIYSSAQKQVQESVNIIKEQEKAKYEAVKDRIAKENAERKRQYDYNDRLKRLAELETLEGYYRPGVTQESQKKYSDIVDEINKIKHEMEEQSISQKQEAELTAAEQSYKAFESSMDALTKKLVDAYMAQNKALIESLATPKEEMGKMDENLTNTTDNMGKTMSNFGTDAIDTGNKVADALGQTTQSLTQTTEQMINSTISELNRFRENLLTVQQAVIDLQAKGQSLQATMIKQSQTTINNQYQNNGNYVFNNGQDWNDYDRIVSKTAFGSFKLA